MSVKLSETREAVVYVVVKKYSYDKDQYIAAYLNKGPADRHRIALSGEPDPQEDIDYGVWTIPLRTDAP